MNKELMNHLGFNKYVVRVSRGLCPYCNRPTIGEFRDELSKIEHSISGMCQSCQDEVFDEQE